MLHSGLTKLFPIDIGQALVIVSFVVMLAWIPLREMPGLGTISNAIVIGLSTDVFLAVLPTPHAIGRARRAAGRPASCCRALATAAYIGAQLGRGPRDGLMTGLARRTGRSLRLVRTADGADRRRDRACCSAASPGIGTIALRRLHRPAQPGPAAADDRAERHRLTRVRRTTQGRQKGEPATGRTGLGFCGPG